MLAGTLLISSNANAQDKVYAKEYPHYGFWSNWSLGGKLIFNGEFMKGSNNYGLGFGLFAEKELNYVWAFRLAADFDELIPIDKDHQDKYATVGPEFKFSINNAIKGYDPERRNSLYLLAGAGFTIKYDGDYQEDMGDAGIYLRGGLGFSHKYGSRLQHSIFAELYGDLATDVLNPFKDVFDGWHNLNGNLAIGYAYNFGPTAADEEAIAQRKLLTQENFDRLNNENEKLNKDLRDAKNQETKLINRVNELENNNKNDRPVMKEADNRVADSLRKVIDGYKSERDSYYAMPFSILYDIDQYTVSEDQMGKLKAIAQVIKNSGKKFDIVGYCDNSGSREYNQKLSEKRANEVKRLLVKKYGVDENQLTTSGKGKDFGFGDIKNAINRRVSFYRQ